MVVDYAGSILLSLRRIIRSIDQHNKLLGLRYELTVPQLVCLRQLLADGEMAPGMLAKAVYLSQATVTGIIDRLLAKELVSRERSTSDRRKVIVRLTDKGHQLASEMPWPLQERFSKSLADLEAEEIIQIDTTLKRLAAMMEAPTLPIWAFGPNDTIAPEQINSPQWMEKPDGSPNKD